MYRRAAQDGDAEAYFRLGRLYASKHPLFDDPARAVGLLERALSENVYGAERELARLYEDGRGVPKDLARARDLYAVAADGNPWAARDAGRAWASSDGVVPDFEQAVRWYRRAAEGGVPWAALDLAKLTEAGRGVEQDRIAALIWYATAQGLSDDPNLARLVTEAVASYAPDDYNFAAQRLLVGMGEDIGEPDGQIGPQTRTALDSVFASRGKSPPGDVITLEVLADLSTFN